MAEKIRLIDVRLMGVLAARGHAMNCYSVATNSRRMGEIPPPAAALLDPAFPRSKIEVVGRPDPLCDLGLYPLF